MGAFITKGFMLLSLYLPLFSVLSRFCRKCLHLYIIYIYICKCLNSHFGCGWIQELHHKVTNWPLDGKKEKKNGPWVCKPLGINYLQDSTLFKIVRRSHTFLQRYVAAKVSNQIPTNSRFALPKKGESKEDAFRFCPSFKPL